MNDRLEPISVAIVAAAGGLMVACALLVWRCSAAWRHGVLAVTAVTVTVGAGLLAANMRQVRDAYRVESLYRQIDADLQPLPSGMICGTGAMMDSMQLALLKDEARAVGVVAAVASGILAGGVMVLTALWARRARDARAGFR